MFITKVFTHKPGYTKAFIEFIRHEASKSTTPFVYKDFVAELYEYLGTDGCYASHFWISKNSTVIYDEVYQEVEA